MNEPTKALAVLIVEDMESDAQLIVRLLKKAGYELVYEQVETAEQMRAALEKHAWDIIISDYKLPGFDGRAALKLLQDTGCDIPFIVVSGTIGEETSVAMMRAGAHDYLVKSDLARLIPAVEREINQAEIRRERKRVEERFELIKDSIDAASDGVYWMDREGWFIYVNGAGCKALGYSRDELLQIRVFDVNPRLTVHRWAELWQILRDKRVFTTESVHRRKDGSEFPVELTSNYIIFGEQEYVNEFARDITERARVEEALRESEERFRSLFDRMLDGMYRSTHAGKFVDINPAMVKMFGYSSKEEMLEINIKKELYFDPAERGSHILDTGQQETEVYRMRRKDGSEIWVEDRGYYVHDEQGRITFHEGMLRDVTERVRAEEALRESEERFRSVFENVTIGLYRTTPDGQILLANTTFARMLGCESVDELMQRNKDGDCVVTEYPRSEFLQLMESQGQVRGFEAYGKRIDGTLIFVRENAKAVRDSNGKILYFEGAVEDITERKRAEEIVRQSEAKLKKAQHFAHVGSWVWNIKTNELEWSDEMYYIFGINKESFSGVLSDVIAQSIHPDDRYKVEQSNLSVINEAKPVALEYRVHLA